MRNKFLRKVCWLIYGICGIIWPRYFYIYIFQKPYISECNALTLGEFIFINLSFFILHWIALKFTQYIGLREKKLKYFQDRLLYVFPSLLILDLIIIPNTLPNCPPF